MKKIILPLVFASLTSASFIHSAHAGPTPEAKALIQAEMKKAEHISPMELQQKLKTQSNIVLLDIRQKSERPIMGAMSESDVHIPRGFLEILTYSKIQNRDAEIVVFCGKGIRSAFAANSLEEMGYTNVKNLKGGVKGWKDAGFKTVKPN